MAQATTATPRAAEMPDTALMGDGWPYLRPLVTVHTTDFNRFHSLFPSLSPSLFSIAPSGSKFR
jgi:hypothetical protein